MRTELSDGEISLINLAPTSRQNHIALAAVALLVAELGVVAPFAATPLPRLSAFIPFLNATILVTDLITAILLFAHFSVYRSPALLVLASGYLFTSLIVIPHALTFPGAFSPTGLLGAGPQTTAWLYIFWHFGFPGAILVYVWLKDRQFKVQGSNRSAIAGCVALTIFLVSALVLLATVGDPLLPRLFLDTTHLTLFGKYSPSFDLLFCAMALVSLWTRRRSILDLWLIVVVCALIGELAITLVRFSLGFYVSRLFSLVTSSIVLIMLLRETANLYARLVHSNAMLKRERENKLMNLEAMSSAISHEVRQPLAAISMNGEAALDLLEHSPPNLEEACSALKDIIDDSHRASDIFKNLRALFGKPQEKRAININDIIGRVLRILRVELEHKNITSHPALTAELPFVAGQEGQLQEVVINLVQNAIEAMAATKGRARILRIRTEPHGENEIAVSVEDSGPGIDPDRISSMFDAFVTTKSSGMGLGLAICRMIVESHGGRISASPAAEGGALFQFVLPVK